MCCKQAWLEQDTFHFAAFYNVALVHDMFLYICLALHTLTRLTLFRNSQLDQPFEEAATLPPLASHNWMMWLKTGCVLKTGWVWASLHDCLMWCMRVHPPHVSTWHDPLRESKRWWPARRCRMLPRVLLTSKCQACSSFWSKHANSFSTYIYIWKRQTLSILRCYHLLVLPPVNCDGRNWLASVSRVFAKQLC